MFPFNLTGLIGGVIISLLVGSIGTGYLVHHYDQADLLKVRLADASALQKATEKAAQIQEAQDADAEAAAVKESGAQAVIQQHTVTITKEVVTHVSDSSHCITYGFVRLLHDAATGDSSAEQPPPTGQSDDSCAPVTWRQAASDIADDYGTARANAEQLNALEASVIQIQKDSDPPP